MSVQPVLDGEVLENVSRSRNDHTIIEVTDRLFDQLLDWSVRAIWTAVRIAGQATLVRNIRNSIGIRSISWAAQGARPVRVPDDHSKIAADASR